VPRLQAGPHRRKGNPRSRETPGVLLCFGATRWLASGKTPAPLPLGASRRARGYPQRRERQILMGPPRWARMCPPPGGRAHQNFVISPKFRVRALRPSGTWDEGAGAPSSQSWAVFLSWPVQEPAQALPVGAPPVGPARRPAAVPCRAAQGRAHPAGQDRHQDRRPIRHQDHRPAPASRS